MIRFQVPRHGWRSLCVGGVTLELLAESSTTWCFDPAYREFVGRGRGAYRIRLTADLPTVGSGERTRCSAPGYWSLAEADRTLVFNTYHKDEGELYQVCTFSPAERAGTFYSVPHHGAGGEPSIAPLGFPMDYLIFSKLFLRYHAYLLHGCAVVHDGRCLVFAGAKGAGKSTTARLWARAGGDVLSEEQIVLRLEAGTIRAYGSPWYGETRVCRNVGAPVDALFFIEHGVDNRLVPLDAGRASRELLRKLFLATAFREEIPAVIADCACVASRIPVYRFAFVPDASSVRTVLDVL